MSGARPTLAGVPPAPDVDGGRAAGPHAEPGLFVVLEGGDGTGKSTQAALLSAWLEAGGTPVVTTREPGGTPVGRRVRELLLHGDDVAPRAEALLYAADRAHHVATVVRPGLAAGATVVSDRYVDSTLAYQGGGRGLPAEELAGLSAWATGGLVPDVTVLLDLDPADARARTVRRTSAPDRLEREGAAFHAAVRQRFLALAAAAPHRYAVLDAAGTPEAVAERVRAAVAPWLAGAASLPATAPAEGSVR